MEHTRRRLWREEHESGGGTAADGGAKAWPERRHGHSVVVWPRKGPSLCVYGGFADGGRPLDDLFDLFDLRASCGPSPPLRSLLL
jgi:hypothetical protein